MYSCAQIGNISGGKNDSYAPKLIECNPPNKTKNFSGKKIEFVFNEYFKLNKPNENAIILPYGAKLKISSKKKKMFIQWDENLLSNTSYQINMNSLVQDIRESNDSIMTYVFSTGDYLDSLTIQGIVINSENNVAQEGWTVFLNISDSIQTVKPTYFSKTNNKGEFKIENIKEGKYFLYALKDDNKDLLFQRTEGIAFYDSLVDISNNKNSSFKLKSFSNKELPKIKTKQYISPNLLLLKSTFPILESKLFLDSSTIDYANIKEFKEDSVIVFLNNSLTPENHKLIFDFENNIDTTSFFVSNKVDKLTSFIFPLDKKLINNKIAEYYFNSKIEKFDTSYVYCASIDSTLIQYNYNIKNNKIEFSFPDSINKNIILNIKKEAITFENNQENKENKATFIIKNNNEFGILKFKNKIPENYILEFKNNSKIFKQNSKMINDQGYIDKVEPGEYSLKIILDENKNNKWDTGDFFNRKQAEKIIFFSDKIKLRANWETEIEIDFENMTVK